MSAWCWSFVFSCLFNPLCLRLWIRAWHILQLQGQGTTDNCFHHLAYKTIAFLQDVVCLWLENHQNSHLETDGLSVHPNTHAIFFNGLYYIPWALFDVFQIFCVLFLVPFRTVCMLLALALDLSLTFSNFYCGSSFTEGVLSTHIVFPFFSQTGSLTAANMCVLFLRWMHYVNEICFPQ